jgi:4-hydroxybenzoate polyprenyltransferase
MSDRAHEVAPRHVRPLPRVFVPAGIFAALRPHQWLKNLLLFVPALAAHDFGAGLVASAAGFVSFSLCASGIYVLNDLLDREHDREHPRKRLRPFASGALGTGTGLRMAAALLLGGSFVALWLPTQFLLIMVGYVALAFCYSVALKRLLLVDIVLLACLYGVRLAAGGAASDIHLSPWLAVFSLFLFFCLATVKRCAELADTKSAGDVAPAGRPYRIEDLPALYAMATASGFVSILVLALYMNSDVVRAVYSHPERMWFACIPFMLWIGRVLLLTHRGEMHDDPIVYAATDRTSLAVALACGTILIASI